MIATDLCKLHYQILLITYQEFMIKNARSVWKKIRLNCKFIGFENGRLNYKCKECKKSYTKLTNESIKNFPALYKFCNGNLNKFFLLLRKGIYPYEDMYNWGKFDETTIPPKEAFYSEVNLEDISDEDYVHVQKVWDVFEIKNRGEYHDLYVQSDTLLLALLLGRVIKM